MPAETTYSTNRLIVREKPANLRTALPNDKRQGEGGLRIQGSFKKSVPGTPLVSIITIVYNGEKHLEQTIKSVINQTYPNVEYIVIDGGSNDNTLTILKKYENQTDYWISEPDKGISDAFNKGIYYATGDIIGLINADDWYELNAVETVVANMDKADVVYGNLQYWKEGKKDVLSYPDHRYLKREMSINHVTVFAKKEVYEKWGGFRTEYRIAMDYDLVLRFFMMGATFKYLDYCLANMRRDGVSDARWIAAVKELNRVKTSNGISPVFAFLFSTKLFIRIGLSKLIAKLGLRPIMLKIKEQVISKK